MAMSNAVYTKFCHFFPTFFQCLFCLCFCVDIRQDAQLFLCLQWTSVSSKEPLLLWTAMPHTTPESSSGTQRSPSLHTYCLVVVFHGRVSVFGCIKYGMRHCCSFQWDRGGKPVLTTSGGRVSVRQGSLTIGQTWSGDIGDYTCTVTSAAGNDSHTARLEVMWVHENNDSPATPDLITNKWHVKNIEIISASLSRFLNKWVLFQYLKKYAETHTYTHIHRLTKFMLLCLVSKWDPN